MSLFRGEKPQLGQVDVSGDPTVGAGAQLLVGTMSLLNQSAALAATSLYRQGAFPGPGSGLVPPKGLYLVTYYHSVSQAATTSSSTQLTIAWTDQTGTAQTFTDTELTNTLGNMQQGEITVNADGVHEVTAAASYASSGATAMNYNLFLRLQMV